MQRRLLLFAAFALGAYVLGSFLLKGEEGAGSGTDATPETVAEAPAESGDPGALAGDLATTRDVEALWDFGISRLGWMPPPPEERCEADADQLREWIRQDIELRGLDDSLGYTELGYD